jgi:hypothetical protein
MKACGMVNWQNSSGIKETMKTIQKFLMNLIQAFSHFWGFFNNNSINESVPPNQLISQSRCFVQNKLFSIHKKDAFEGLGVP